MRFGLLLSLAALLALATAPVRAADPGDLQSQVTAANDRYAVAAMHRDAAPIAGDYEPDGTFAKSNGLLLKGREAIRRYYAVRLQRVTITAVHCATTNLRREGDLAWELGSCRITVRTAHGPRTASGSYLTVWHKDADGRWRITANMS